MVDSQQRREAAADLSVLNKVDVGLREGIKLGGDEAEERCLR